MTNLIDLMSACLANHNRRNSANKIINFLSDLQPNCVGKLETNLLK